MGKDKCESCGHWTSEGQRKWRESQKPIYGTDLSRPLSETIADIRNQLTRARGQLFDVGFRFTGWREQLESVEGLLTCGLIALHYTMEEMQRHEAEHAKAAEPAPEATEA